MHSALRAVALTLVCATPWLASPAVAADSNHVAPLKATPSAAVTHLQYVVITLDSARQAPLDLTRVALFRDKTFIAGKIADLNGHAMFRELPPGTYIREINRTGYESSTDTITLQTSRTDSVWLPELQSEVVVVTGHQEQTLGRINTVTGNEVFDAKAAHPAPSTSMTELIAQNMLGAARATTGEVHIRGQHGEFSYFLDGAPIPLGVFGGLNEVVDPSIISSAEFWTGRWPAEYGGQIAGVIDLKTRIPSGPFHLNVASYVGSFLPNSDRENLLSGNQLLNSNGQHLDASGGEGPLRVFISADRKETDRRIDSPVPTIFHDHGFDYFLYGKADYILGSGDLLTLNLNWGRTNTQVPFDSSEVGIEDDIQQSDNAFQTLTYQHTFSDLPNQESQILVAGFLREGALEYTPSAIDAGSVQATATDTTTYALADNRAFTTAGIRTKYDDRLSHHFAFSLGGIFSPTTGNDRFAYILPATTPMPTTGIPSGSTTDFAGSDFGIFAESEWHPAEWTTFNVGVRWDNHIAPDIPAQSQLSPRIKWTVDLDDATTAYAYYGRLFMPPNIEGLRTIAVASDSSDAAGTLAERDDFYEAGIERRIGFGINLKADYFQKESAPGLDDEAIGASAIRTPVNISHIRVQGIEASLTYDPIASPLSGYINAALIHGFGTGTISGGFLPLTIENTGVDLDHDERLSVVASMNYQPDAWFANLTAMYSSGMPNGNPSDAVNLPGLFEFNQSSHVTPSWILNASVGYTFAVDDISSTPSLYVTNLFDHQHLIKGAYFSDASWEAPRNLVFNLKVHL